MLKPASLLVTCALALAGCETDDIYDRQRGQLMICHDGETEVVSNANYLNHTAHGDSAGPCPHDEVAEEES